MPALEHAAGTGDTSMISRSDSHDSLVPPERIERYLQQVRRCECCGEPMIFVPRLVCKGCAGQLDIKCQIYNTRGIYYAECLTLDLLSQGATEDEAVRRLQITMFSYVATAAREGASVQGLIPRRAPLSSWIRYYAHLFAARIKYLIIGRLPVIIRPVVLPEAEAQTVVHCH